MRTDANGPVIEGKIHEPGTFFVKLAKEPNVLRCVAAIIVTAGENVKMINGYCYSRTYE